MAVAETAHDLNLLPLRALLAHSARCARRVQPLYAVDPAHPEAESCAASLDAAIRLAEELAAGRTVAATEAAEAAQATVRALVLASEAGTTEAAAYAANTVYALTDAITAAVESLTASDPSDAAGRLLASTATVTDAAMAADGEVRAAARLDWDVLRRLRLGRFPEPGEPIDPGEDGPLGPLFLDRPLKPSPPSRKPADSVPPPPKTAPARLGPPAKAPASSPAPTAEVTPSTESPKRSIRVKKLRAWVRKLRRQREQLDSERTAFRAERAIFQSEQKTIELQREEVLADREALQEQIGLLDRQQNELQAERTGLKQQNQEIDSERQRLKTLYAELEAEQERLRTERETLDAELKTLQAQQEQTAAAAGRLDEERRQFEQERAALADDRRLLEEDRRVLDTECERLQRQTESLAAERRGLAEQKSRPERGERTRPAGSSESDREPIVESDVRPLRLLVQRGMAGTAEVSELLHELSELYRALGGAGVSFEVTNCRTTRREGRARPADNHDERAFVELQARPQVEGRSQPGAWEQFRACLRMVMRLDAGLAAAWDQAAAAPAAHSSRQVVCEAIDRARSAERRPVRRNQGDGLRIDSVNRELQRVEYLLRTLERQYFLGIELAPLVEAEAAPARNAAAASGRRSAVRRRTGQVALLLIAGATGLHFWPTLARLLGLAP